MRTGSLLKGLFTLTVLGLSVFTTVKAKPVNVETAIKVASTQIQVMDLRYKDGGLLYSVYVIREECVKPLYDETEEELLAYVFELEPQGFVVVTADDDLVPVIACSELGSFCWEEHPENILLNMLRQDLSLRLEALPLIEREVIEGNHRHWEGLIAGDPLYLDPGESWPPAGSTWTGGWVESAWHQRSPYNNVCPIDPLTMERCVVGCVATALGQILNYWQYPDSIVFTEADNYITRTRKIEINAPDASIPEIDYNNGSPSIGTCAAISYACGVGVKMNYTSESSGAYYADAHEFLLNHLNYESADYDTIPDEELFITLEDNMKNAQPAFLGITESDTIDWGHAVICDGFRETAGDNEWHLNFGWGSYNPDPLLSSWYVLPEGLPAGYSWVDIGILNISPPQANIGEELTHPYKETLICDEIFTGYSNEISYNLHQESRVTIDVWSSCGRCVRKLIDCHQTSGYHIISWDGCDDVGNQVSRGVYYLRFVSDDQNFTQKIVLLR